MGHKITMMEFQWPLVFFAIPLPYLIWRFLPPVESGSGHALRTPFFHEWATFRETSSRSAIPPARAMVLPVIAWIFFIGASAKPVWVGEPVTLASSGRDLMLAVDLSGSMERADFFLNKQQVDRLTAVKAVASRFIKQRQGDRLGLILFGKQAYVQTPLTYDSSTVSSMLLESEIGLAGTETAIGDAIGLAVKRLRDLDKNSRVLILLTDGANTAGEVEPLQAAALAADLGLKIYTIGVGADRMEVSTFFGSRTVDPSADLDETTLQGIADVTGGQYFRAKDTRELRQIYKKLDELEPTVGEAQTFRPIVDLYYWPLSISLLLLSLIGLLRYSSFFSGVFARKFARVLPDFLKLKAND